MSTTSKETANEPAKAVRTTLGAAVPKPSNPARPSKFAGLNLRQRSSEPPPTESERVPAPLALPEEHSQPDAELGAEVDAEPSSGTETQSAGTVEIESNPTTTERQTPSAASTESASAPKPLSNEAGQAERHAEPRQQSATSGPAVSAHSARQLRVAPAEMEHTPTRRRGKRTDPEYVQVTAYVRQETYRRARIKLLESTKPQEFSEVVEELLTRWLGASR